jgi:hypothetical protein
LRFQLVRLGGFCFFVSDSFSAVPTSSPNPWKHDDASLLHRVYHPSKVPPTTRRRTMWTSLHNYWKRNRWSLAWSLPRKPQPYFAASRTALHGRWFSTCVLERPLRVCTKSLLVVLLYCISPLTAWWHPATTGHLPPGHYQLIEEKYARRNSKLEIYQSAKMR